MVCLTLIHLAAESNACLKRPVICLLSTSPDNQYHVFDFLGRRKRRAQDQQCN